MEISFRAAQVADLATLVQLMQEYYEFDHHPFDPAAARSAMERLLKDDSLGAVWLICDTHQAVGYTVLCFGYSLEYLGRDAFIDEIYIRASHRGQGLGTQTLQLLARACADLGIQALHLEVERQNTKAQAFYRKVGFYNQDRYLMTQWIAEPPPHWQEHN